MRTADGFDCKVLVTRDDQSVSGTSILGLMLLGAGEGTELTLQAEGKDAEAAMDALTDLIERGLRRVGGRARGPSPCCNAVAVL